jgi:hypothetical protein
MAQDPRPKREISISSIVAGSVQDARRAVLRPYTLMFDTADGSQWHMELEGQDVMLAWVAAIENVCGGGWKMMVATGFSQVTCK